MREPSRPAPNRTRVGLKAIRRRRSAVRGGSPNRTRVGLKDVLGTREGGPVYRPPIEPEWD